MISCGKPARELALRNKQLYRRFFRKYIKQYDQQKQQDQDLRLAGPQILILLFVCYFDQPVQIFQFFRKQDGAYDQYADIAENKRVHYAVKPHN